MHVGRVVVGIGGVCAGAAGLRDVLVQARETCRALRLQGGGRQVQAFSDLNNHRLLLGMLDDDALARFSNGVLGALREHDRRRGGDLEATLRVFLELDGSYAETADRLHVHVNTLRQRLAKITELTGRDPRRTNDRVDLVLALEADALALGISREGLGSTSVSATDDLTHATHLGNPGGDVAAPLERHVAVLAGTFDQPSYDGEAARLDR